MGKKNNLTIPPYILNNKQEIKCSFIKGLFDTDGSFNLKKERKVYLSKNNININK